MTNPKDAVGAKKAPLRYVPPALYIGAAEAMESGATRYGPMNWRDQPVSAVTYAEAMLRHIFAWLDGQDYAEDSGIHHLRHVAAGDGILLDALANGTLIDDRFTKGPAAKMLAELDRSKPPTTIEEAGITPEDIDRVADMLKLTQPEPCACHTPGVPVGDEHRAQFGPTPEIEGTARRSTLCICPPVRASYGDHLLTCPRYEAALSEPYRDVGGQG